MTDYYQEQQTGAKEGPAVFWSVWTGQREDSATVFRQAGFSEQAAQDAVLLCERAMAISMTSRYAFNYITYRIHEKSRQKIFQELHAEGGGQGD